MLEADGVRLEPMTIAHVPELFAAAQDDAIWQWLPVARPRTEAEMRTMVEEAVSDGGRAPLTMMFEGRAQGSTSFLDIDLGVGGLEVGWTWYARPLWATAVNPTCKLLMLGHAFESLGAGRVTLKTDINNTRSQAAIRRLGAHHDGTLRHHRRRPDGSVRDSVYFSILAAEWPEVRAGLEARLRRPG